MPLGSPVGDVMPVSGAAGSPVGSPGPVLGQSVSSSSPGVSSPVGSELGCPVPGSVLSSIRPVEGGVTC